MSQPRPGFGPDAVAPLLHDLQDYLDQHGPDHVTRAALNTLQAYLAFNDGHGVEMPGLRARHEALLARQAATAPHAQGE